MSAAAVIGSRFDLDLLTVLGVEPAVDDLVAAQLIDQVKFTRQPEYVFHHPLIRAVAYEAQLKSDRAELHRRVAAAIEAGDPGAADENAALIAEHLEAAGDLRSRLRLAHARRNVVNQPRHRRGSIGLGARAKDGRRVTRRGAAPDSDPSRAPNDVVWSAPGAPAAAPVLLTPVSTNCANCAVRLAIRCHW